MIINWINGTLCSADDATVSAFDSAFQHGLGVFDTMIVGVSPASEKDNTPHAVGLRVPDHIDRLLHSARELALTDGLSRDGLCDAVLEVARQVGAPRVRVRVTITGGDLNMLNAAKATTEDTPKAHVGPTVMISGQPATNYPEEMMQLGVLATIADTRANNFNAHESHKTVNYWWRLRALQEASGKQASESLVFTISNHLAGGCVSNAFVVKDGVLYTPIARGEEADAAAQQNDPNAAINTVPSPVLPGITRAFIIAAAQTRGYTVEKRWLTAAEVLDADELFLTNASWGVLPVVGVEASKISEGPGPITMELRTAWLDDMHATFAE